MKNGFSSGFQYALPKSQIDNFSVGIGGVFLNEGIEKVERGDYDVVVIDCAVNDEILAQRKPELQRIFLRNFENLIFRICRSGSIPLVAILPRLEWLENNQAPPVANSYMSFCQDNSIPFLNGYSLIRRVLDIETSLTLADLFNNAAHLKRPLAGIIGSMMGIEARKLKQFTTQKREIRSSAEFRYVPFTHDAEQTGVVVHKNSLRCDKLRKLSEGESLSVPLAPGAKVAAVLYNSNVSDGTLIAEAAGTRCTLIVSSKNDSPHSKYQIGGVVTNWSYKNDKDVTVTVSLSETEEGKSYFELLGLVVLRDKNRRTQIELPQLKDYEVSARMAALPPAIAVAALTKT
ncbi:hypothetical protein [Roseovarius indicus]|nr:hypothetical protein [Roseovarius indicus]